MIDARARDVGQVHNLGGYLGYFESSGGWGRTFLGFLLFLAGISIAGSGIGIGSLRGLEQAAAICAGVAVATVGIALIATVGQRETNWIFVYDGGVAQVIRGGAALRIIPWGRFGHVVKHYYYGDADIPPRLGTIRITGADGTVITADTPNGDSLCQLERHIDMVVTAMRLRGAIEQCRAGVPVVFGRLSVSRDGIGWDVRAGYVAWRDIRSIRVSPDCVVLGTGARKKHQRVAVLGVDGIPDWCVAVRLIQNLAAQLAIPQQGTAAVPPPGAWYVDTTLSEADVGRWVPDGGI